MKTYGYKELIWKVKGCGKKWLYDDRFIKFIKEETSKGRSIANISKEVGIYHGVLRDIIEKEDIKTEHNRSSMNFKAIYQEYDWCYKHWMCMGMNHEEMAREAGCSKRVIEKWCCEKHGLNQKYRQANKKLNEIQRDMIVGSLLGDGHIDNRETQPIFIVSHAENQKDYLFWKYEIVKDLCNSKPTYYDKNLKKVFKTGVYNAQPYYRISSRIHDCLLELRDMSNIELMKELNEFSFSVQMLDDGSRSESNWSLCIAPYNNEEKEFLIKTLNERFGLDSKINKDDRYLMFTSDSSRMIDSIILKNIPNNLDIIKCKITENKINSKANYRFVSTENGRVGLARFCRMNGISDYRKNKDYIMMKNIFDKGIKNGEDLINEYNNGRMS